MLVFAVAQPARIHKVGTGRQDVDILGLGMSKKMKNTAKQIFLEKIQNCSWDVFSLNASFSNMFLDCGVLETLQRHQLCYF